MDRYETVHERDYESAHVWIEGEVTNKVSVPYEPLVYLVSERVEKEKGRGGWEERKGEREREREGGKEGGRGGRERERERLLL